MKRFIVIGSPDDLQAVRWFQMCRSWGTEAYFFDVQKLGIDWHICDNSASGMSLRPRMACDVWLSDSQNCWYLRGPSSGPRPTLEALSLLHWNLALFAYPEGNYFQKSDEEWHVECKMLQLCLFRCRVPETLIISPLRSSIGGDLRITKSMSSTRSIVVQTSDVRLHGKKSRAATPVQLQEFVAGTPIKCHYYKNRSGEWYSLTVAALADELDYRYTNCKYHVRRTPVEADYLATKIEEMFGSRFFDIDFIVTPYGLTFLEVNFSPAPVYFERALWGGLPRFSAQVLMDWLQIQ